MESIEQYGNLSEQELLDFLHEIESSDEDMQEAQSEAAENIALEETYASLSEGPELSEEAENAEIEAHYGEDAWRQLKSDNVLLFGPDLQRKANATAVQAHKQKAALLKEDRIRIQRMAFSQNIISLSEPISKENLKNLITQLVAAHTRMVDKYANFINKRLTVLLNPFIPRRLRICKDFYPNSIRMSPGFLYRASKEYGFGKTFWACPSIPFYLKQNTEQQLLLKHKSEYLIMVDKGVANFHMHSEKRAAKEIKYASTLVRRHVETYFDLLRLNPFWFETLYNLITAEKDEH